MKDRRLFLRHGAVHHSASIKLIDPGRSEVFWFQSGATYSEV